MSELPHLWITNGLNTYKIAEQDRAEWEANGWEACEAPEVVAPTSEPEPDAIESAGDGYDFAAHKVGELRAFAEAAGIDGEGLKKADLIAALSASGFEPGQGQCVPDADSPSDADPGDEHRD